jgi:hypothetical protein
MTLGSATAASNPTGLIANGREIEDVIVLMHLSHERVVPRRARTSEGG